MSQVAAAYPAVNAMREQDASHRADLATIINPDLPDSQDSILSTVSSTFSAPVPFSSSNPSTITTLDNDASPTVANVVPSSHGQHMEAAMYIPSNQARSANAFANAPRIDPVAANTQRTGDTAASPMSLDLAQGFKRTADGSVKGLGIATETPTGQSSAHKRNKSMDTHSGRGIGERSATLKTRLSYAMVKLQNGWERQSLEELEEGHSQRGSPNSAPGRTDLLVFDSPSTMYRRRRPSGVSDNSDQIIMSPASDPARSSAATPLPYWRPGHEPALSAAVNLISVTGSSLAPAPDLQTGRRRRSSASNPPPPLLGTTQRKYYSDLSGSGPRTPATPRAGILRMPSQQAEKDAVDTLLFMSSPNNSQRFPPGVHAAPSPLRANAPQRRVMFEAFPQQEKRGGYAPNMQASPQHHQYGPYAAHPAR